MTVRVEDLSAVITNALTVDVEDYFQVSAFREHVSPDDWPRFESRVVANTHRVLDVFDAGGASSPPPWSPAATRSCMPPVETIA